ncbi:8330_t:CDS:10 [Gigaspora rosea]|nr:8330_t:CDS:10 [Gigaspora rosea]
MINIAIDGAIASGKTTVGKLIAKNLNYQFIDTGKKEFAVVGRDVTFNILPDAEIMILLSADIDIRALRRAHQLNSENINDIWLDILNRDSKSFNLIKEAKKVSKIIDTTNLTLAEVVDLVLTQNLSNEVDNDAFEFAFPNKDKRLTFARNLLEYYNACVLEIKRIEGVMPKAVSHLEEYFENLENEIVADEEEQYLRFLNKPQPHYQLTWKYIRKQFNNLSEYSVDILLESPISVQSNSIYTTDEEFSKNNYIIKQNGIVEENNIIFSDEELKMDDSDEEYLPTEDKALNSYEKAKLELKELHFVCFQEGFKKFLDGKECLFKTAIYFTILDDDKVSKLVEPNNNNDYYNYTSGYEFEKILRKILKVNRILANEVKITQGDNEIDIIAIYKKNTILIQCKRYKSAIGVTVIRDFESAISQFPNSLEQIIKTKNGLFFQQVITNKYKQVIDEINELEDYYYVLIDRGFKEIEIFQIFLLKMKKAKNIGKTM